MTLQPVKTCVFNIDVRLADFKIVLWLKEKKTTTAIRFFLSSVKLCLWVALAIMEEIQRAPQN